MHVSFPLEIIMLDGYVGVENVLVDLTWDFERKGAEGPEVDFCVCLWRMSAGG